MREGETKSQRDGETQIERKTESQRMCQYECMYEKEKEERQRKGRKRDALRP